MDETVAYETADAEPARATPVRAQLASKLLAAVGAEPMTLADVARAVGRGPTDGSVRRALDGLRETGELRQTDDRRWCQVPDPPVAGTLAPGTANGDDGSDDLVERAEHLRDRYLEDEEPAPRCRCKNPLLDPSDGEPRCARCGKRVAA